MELKHLKTFKVITDVGGFTKAADVLGYAQSSVTAHIQTLEDEIGSPIFDRIGKKVVITDAGKKLLPYAIQMLDLYDRARHIAKEEENPAGTIKIGAPESLTVYRLPAIISAYKKLYPNVQIIIKTFECWRLKELLRRGEIDIALLLQPEHEDSDLQITKLIDEPMNVIAPIEHPLAKKHDEPISIPLDETFIYTEKGCDYRATFENHLIKHGYVPDTSLEFWSIEAIKQCVMCGLGISYLPSIAVQTELKEGKITSLDWKIDGENVSTLLAFHKNKWLSPALDAFVEICTRFSIEWQEETVKK
ncbi:LysR family transcriptional regulator [Cytobacillus sp. IB215665]|uniref:LysR family transcriptional regulator n=1 Tax=Cytobacillus sp. IB215665 TaxID=3097357 RepID=UPI002A13EAD5|nr:LysR family transcriptional regulator [Cytobacillus sp. IB215665]MDX8364316.1 LysR family transcriptional regulator [Cytobacillus sp. IB215665]